MANLEIDITNIADESISAKYTEVTVSGFVDQYHDDQYIAKLTSLLSRASHKYTLVLQDTAITPGPEPETFLEIIQPLAGNECITHLIISGMDFGWNRGKKADDFQPMANSKALPNIKKVTIKGGLVRCLDDDANCIFTALKPRLPGIDVSLETSTQEAREKIGPVAHTETKLQLPEEKRSSSQKQGTKNPRKKDDDRDEDDNNDGSAKKKMKSFSATTQAQHPFTFTIPSIVALPSCNIVAPQTSSSLGSSSPPPPGDLTLGAQQHMEHVVDELRNSAQQLKKAVRSYKSISGNNPSLRSSNKLDNLLSATSDVVSNISLSQEMMRQLIKDQRDAQPKPTTPGTPDTDLPSSSSSSLHSSLSSTYPSSSLSSSASTINQPGSHSYPHGVVDKIIPPSFTGNSFTLAPFAARALPPPSVSSLSSTVIASSSSTMEPPPSRNPRLPRLGFSTSSSSSPRPDMGRPSDPTISSSSISSSTTSSSRGSLSSIPKLNGSNPSSSAKTISGVTSVSSSATTDEDNIFSYLVSALRPKVF